MMTMRRIISRLLLGILFFGCMSFALNWSNYLGAVTVYQSPLAQKVNCQNPQSTGAMLECASIEAEKADQKLNQLYQQIQKKETTSQKKRLTNAQIAWINFRDKTCEYEGGQFEGGSLANVTQTSCIATVTNQRVSDFKDYLEMLSNR